MRLVLTRGDGKREGGLARHSGGETRKNPGFAAFYANGATVTGPTTVNNAFIGASGAINVDGGIRSFGAAIARGDITAKGPVDVQSDFNVILVGSGTVSLLGAS
jgi:hypothetical protein